MLRAGERVRGEPLGPGPLATDGALAGPCDLASFAAATAREGCIDETIAAAIVGTAAALAVDPSLRACLAAIAADERRHAALAWRTVAWALRTGDEAVRHAVARAFASMPSAPSMPEDPDERTLEPHGVLSTASRAAIARATWQRIIAPRASALTAGERTDAPDFSTDLSRSGCTGPADRRMNTSGSSTKLGCVQP
jgi:hypothetical protein